jgi:hypothetical protein
MINGHKNLIAFLLITSFVISPYFAFVKKVNAQVDPSGYQSTGTEGYGGAEFGWSR